MPVPISSTTQSDADQIVVRSYGRVHFGLMEICESQPNCFGGIGLMVEHSVAEAKARLANSSASIGDSSECTILANQHWKTRIEAVVHQWLLSHSCIPIQSINAIQCPLPHQGLGSGTQMACTIAALLLASDPNESISALPRQARLDLLSKLSQRGKRSNIGLCGFLEGGFVVDHGNNREAAASIASPARTQRYDFPDWPVLVLQNTRSMGDSGDDEAALFEQCRYQPNGNRESMIHLVEQELLPAIAAQDWHRFNDALGRYGRWAGQIFEPVQGGVYRTPKIANTVDIAHRFGLLGATQSSWGPTVCAFAQDAEHARWCCSKLQAELSDVDVVVTRAANQPAQVSRS